MLGPLTKHNLRRAKNPTSQSDAGLHNFSSCTICPVTCVIRSIVKETNQLDTTLVLSPSVMIYIVGEADNFGRPVT